MKKKIVICALLTSAMAFAAEEYPELYEFCEDIPENLAVKVDVPQIRSKIAGQKYTLRRKSENVYDVYLNLMFKPTKDYNKKYVDKKTLNQEIKKKMNACFETYESRLVDERGRKIRLHVYDKEKDKLPSPPPLVKIKLVGSEGRSHSLAYESDIDCPTMIHEALHLVGLVDEYRELWMGFNHSFVSLIFNPLIDTKEGIEPAFDCRAIGPRVSVMRNQWNLSFERGLYSAHVNAIIYPNCKKRNEKYFTCAEFAYQTSHENNGALPNISDCAPKVPQYCKDENWLITDK